jgi:hypothetical protein
MIVVGAETAHNIQFTFCHFVHRSPFVEVSRYAHSEGSLHPHLSAYITKNYKNKAELIKSEKIVDKNNFYEYINI